MTATDDPTHAPIHVHYVDPDAQFCEVAPDRPFLLFTGDGSEALASEAIAAGVTVSVGALDSGDGFYVADDGPGVPPDERDDVFQVGYTTREGGTGFGLAIVDEIVDAHGWTVTMTESEGGGTRFEFSDVSRTPVDGDGTDGDVVGHGDATSE